MENIINSLTEAIGKTPLLRAQNFIKSEGLEADLLLKLEFFNPGGSVKDRPALAMIRDAEERGLLTKGGTIIEPTSGNTGIGLAWIGKSLGYHVILTMPETMSDERKKLLKYLGAELVLTPGKDGMAGAVEKANYIKTTLPNSIITGQFHNPANPLMHEKTTAEELWAQTAGKIDVFVGGVGTGGTISGVGRKLKVYNPNVEIVAVEPETSPLLSTGKAGPHKIQGIGANFVPENFDHNVVNQILTIGNEEAMDYARKIALSEGVVCGISSGAALCAATKLAKEAKYKNKMIVALLPDTGERYISTALFNE